MALKILEVMNSSTPKKEVVRLRATTDLNMLGYALVDRTFDEDGKVSNEFRHIYVFPSQKVKQGDFVRLYTCEGEYDTRENDKDFITHFFYWGSKECVWNDKGGDTATLIKYQVINSVKVPPVKK